VTETVKFEKFQSILLKRIFSISQVYVMSPEYLSAVTMTKATIKSVKV